MTADELLSRLWLSEPAEPADLALVFGSSDLAEATRRAERGAELYAGGFAPRVLFSGGDPAGRGRSEAEVMGEIAAARGVPAAAVLVEGVSNTTVENVSLSHKLLARAGLQDGLRVVLLVSAGWHLRRVRALAGRVFGPSVRFVCCAAGAGDDPIRSQSLELERALLAALGETV